MEIYIEYVFLDNLVIDALLWYATLKILRLPIHKFGLFTATVFGASFAVVSPLITLSGILAMLLKILVAVIMAFMVGFNFHCLLKKVCIFVLLTFGFGGGLLAIFYFMQLPVYDNINFGYISNLPIGSLLGGTIILFMLLINIINKCKIYRTHSEQMITINLQLFEHTKSINAFYDTGNMLQDSNGKSVVVIKEELLANWLNIEERMLLMLGKTKKLRLNNIQEININSLGNTYKMRVFDAQIQQKNKSIPVAIGVANKSFSKCDAIIGTKIWEECIC